MAQSVEHATAAQTVPGSNLRHSFLLDQNLGICVSCERIGKIEDCVKTLACASVITLYVIRLVVHS